MARWTAVSAIVRADRASPSTLNQLLPVAPESCVVSDSKDTTSKPRIAASAAFHRYGCRGRRCAAVVAARPLMLLSYVVDFVGPTTDIYIAHKYDTVSAAEPTLAALCLCASMFMRDRYLLWVVTCKKEARLSQVEVLLRVGINNLLCKFKGLVLP